MLDDKETKRETSRTPRADVDEMRANIGDVRGGYVPRRAALRGGRGGAAGYKADDEGKVDDEPAARSAPARRRWRRVLEPPPESRVRIESTNTTLARWVGPVDGTDAAAPSVGGPGDGETRNRPGEPEMLKKKGRAAIHVAPERTS